MQICAQWSERWIWHSSLDICAVGSAVAMEDEGVFHYPTTLLELQLSISLTAHNIQEGMT